LFIVIKNTKNPGAFFSIPVHVSIECCTICDRSAPHEHVQYAGDTSILCMRTGAMLDGTPSLLGTEMTDWRLISFQSPYSTLLNRQTDRDLFCHSAADFKSLHSLTPPLLLSHPQWRTSDSHAIVLQLCALQRNVILT